MKAQDYKDIKIANIGNRKVLSVNEILWQKKSLGPGPKKLIGGNLQAGFYGEVPTSEFITGDELARIIGLTAGTSQFSNEPWLKFSYMGKVEFVAKKPFRHTITWDKINAVNAVFGNKIIEINGLKYKARLPKGKSEGKQGDQSEDSGDICKNSEWNKLFLPIHTNAPDKWRYKGNVNSPTENWNVKYTDIDLVTISAGGNGWYTLCQEYGKQISTRMYRGYYGVSYSGSTGAGYGSNSSGWRPVLELVD